MDSIRFRIPKGTVQTEEGYFTSTPVLQENAFHVADFHGNLFYLAGNPPYSSKVKQDAGNPSIKKEDYLKKANTLIQDLSSDEDLHKVVYSRYTEEELHYSGEELFEKLCNAYPSAFVYYMRSDLLGSWIGASPELLFGFDGNTLQTMSLAGTKKFDDTTPWGDKELREQNTVTEYIEDILKMNNNEVTVSKTKEQQAGKVKHLRTDFTATCSFPQAETILKALHPTPAVCGTPLERAKKKIDELELHDRKLYTGYLGYVGEKCFDLFVNLRCAEVLNGKLGLYLGGGFNDESNAEAEWEETVLKSKTFTEIL